MKESAVYLMDRILGGSGSGDMLWALIFVIKVQVSHCYFFFLMCSFQRVFLPNLLPTVKCFQTSSWLSFRIVSHCVGQTSLELVILFCLSAKSTIHGCPLPPLLVYLVLISSLIYHHCLVLTEFFVMIFALNANPLILSSLILF